MEPSDHNTKSKIFSATKKAGTFIKDRAGRLGRISWKGAAIGAVLASIIFLVIMGMYVKTGISTFLDIIIIILIVILGIPLGILLTRWLFLLIKNFNPWFVACVASSLLAAHFMPLSSFSKPLIYIGITSGAMLGIAYHKNTQRYIAILLVAIVFLSLSWVMYALMSAGPGHPLQVSDAWWSQPANTSSLQDPSMPGGYATKTLYYGSGTDRHRKEFGAETDIITSTVNANPYFDQTKGLANKVREAFWGFNSSNYPINGRVWYPDGDGPFPLVLIVHGNHLMHDFSDPGYAYLGELLSGRGYILASIDQNFINGFWMGDYNQSEVFTRGWLLLKHLELWRAWNDSSGHVFHNKVDMNNIALMGHSRGGAAVAVASMINQLPRYHQNGNHTFDFNFNIKGVVQIAPNDPYYPQNDIPTRGKNVDYLLLHGGYDQDMFFMLGNRVYNRWTFDDGEYHFKSALYIHHANHGQFNTTWGRKDYAAPMAWLANTRPIMDGEDQRKVAGLFISAFLEASLKGNKEYTVILRDFRTARQWLPKDLYVNAFEDTQNHYFTNYQEDMDLNSTSFPGGRIEGKNLKTWSENALPLRDWGSSQQSLGVYLGWKAPDSVNTESAEYRLHIPSAFMDSLQNQELHNLFFFVCNNDDQSDSVDFTIALSSEGVEVRKSLSDFRLLAPPLKSRLSKWDFIHSFEEKKHVQKIAQYVEIPLKAFTDNNPEFQIHNIDQIRFIFDKTESGEIFLDKIGMN
jgi:dienelactone hydrolase